MKIALRFIAAWVIAMAFLGTIWLCALAMAKVIPIIGLTGTIAIVFALAAAVFAALHVADRERPF